MYILKEIAQLDIILKMAKPIITMSIYLPFMYYVQSLAFKLTVLRSTFLCLSIEYSLATVILYGKNCTYNLHPSVFDSFFKDLIRQVIL
jgi:hypothetical protein